MALFTIRVELHSATWDDYVKLAASLARSGIVDTVVSDTGVRSQLPPAEYNYEGQATVEQVHQAAKAAADSTGRKNAVVTHEVLRRMWSGLAAA